MSRYVVSTQEVVHETIDGEAILLHLGTGSYYSLAGSGAEIWGLIERGHAAEEIGARLGARYGDEAAVAGAVRDLLDELVAEELVRPAGADVGPPNGASPHPEAPVAERFVAPRLQKFTDMQELLLIDPIHEVDEAVGWPEPRPAGG